MAAEWTTPDAVHSKCGELEGEEAVLTIDEDAATSWRHSATEYHWIVFDMSTTKKITQIRLYVKEIKNFGQDVGLYVYVSDNVEDWGDPVWEGVLNVPLQWNLSGLFDKNGRYIKLLSKDNYYFQRIWEFDAMAEAVAPPVAVGIKPQTLVLTL